MDLAVLPASSKFSDEGRNFFIGPRQDLLVHVEQVLVAVLYYFFIFVTDSETKEDEVLETIIGNDIICKFCK